MMLAMLAGHAGDVENDADDVDGRVKYVDFARKCYKLQHFSSQDGKHKNKKKISTRSENPVYLFEGTGFEWTPNGFVLEYGNPQDGWFTCCFPLNQAQK